MNRYLEEDIPNWNRFWSYNPNPDDPHEFGECMEDWHDYEWRKEQKEMDWNSPLNILIIIRNIG
ncbi:hypothetical protein [Akkermansia sp.]